MLRKVYRVLKHYFVPHSGNNYRAKALHHTSLLFYIGLLVVTQSCYLFYRDINPNILGYATDISPQRLLSLVNRERVNASLKPLIINDMLANAAKKKGEDMFARNYWAHISPTGTTPWEFITGEGYQYVYAGENLAKSFDTSEEVVAAWMKSPTHRANILKPEYTEIGFAVENGMLNGEATTLVVQEFGSRTNAAVAQTPESAPVAEASLQESSGSEPVAAKPAPSVLGINRKFSLTVAEVLLVALTIDSFFIWKHRTVRIQGHSLAHIMFILALLGAISATGIGAVL